MEHLSTTDQFIIDSRLMRQNWT